MLDFVIGTRLYAFGHGYYNKLDLTTPESLGGDFQQLSSFLNFSRVISFPLPQYLRPKWGWS